jgi:adenylate cyclase
VAERAIRMNSPAPFWYFHFHGFAQFHLGRYDMAVELFKQALDQNLDWQNARRYLIAAYGHLGRREDAAWQIAESQVLGYNETLTEAKRYRLPYRDPRYRERLLDGLRKAGLPE